MNQVSIFQSLLKRLTPYHPIILKSPAIISFSGGKDSNILLSFYQYLFQESIIQQPILFHLNHKIRYNQSEEDEIHNWMKRLGFPFQYIEKNIPKLSKRLSKSLEETGRLARYNSLIKLARHHNGYITTGHHSKDYLESVFIHWIRGGGTASLQTLPVWNGKILRPLLFLEDKELDFLYSEIPQSHLWDDESNQDMTYLRNRIRIKAIDFFEKEKLNFNRLFRFFQGDDLQETGIGDSLVSSKLYHSNRYKEFLTIPSSTIELIPTIQIWKNILDMHSKLLTLHPMKKKSIETSYNLIRRNKSFEFSTKEIILTKQSKGPLYIFPFDSKAFLKPCELTKEGARMIQWNNKTYKLDATQDWSTPIPGETIHRNGVNRVLSEVLRESYIPPLVRNNIPVLRKNGVATKILLELFIG